MNSKKKYLVLYVAAMSMVPFHSQAATGQVGLEACADVLVSKLSASSGTEVSYKLDADNAGFERKINSLELYSLYAKDPQSNELVSRMDCVVNSKGHVVRTTVKSLNSKALGNEITKVN